mmetsp:Transcript_28761/g.39798  ORF Transcript_28761/g.39798 Transcript_28761/m.39798 type:complete len:386 (+) Transcript_28761:123-1280(+)|eukprot:CAMPEP_0201491558 /NCGR_PEP_ID=MMETSP0151_2-20130828/30266_1 /ASSEMBLY_ACC=CAM_ASM_000257 /TAXON_ID=200890 /ORGANISM="Paramoeba atlantica, Strain 621/1 / CCAP 1560/9" /LENGTH=385 /DNA_ID=CAMNT_0047877965 /DNA_START=117 /DNA_END=1274 /DNA_ORIENTATION=-
MVLLLLPKCWLFVLVLLVPSVFSTSWYVSPEGSDNTGDGSAGNPWQTLTYATDQAAANDIIVLLKGVYSGSANWPTVSKSLSYVGTATIKGDGFQETCFKVSGASNLQMTNMVLLDCGTAFEIDDQASILLDFVFIESSDFVFRILNNGIRPPHQVVTLSGGSIGKSKNIFTLQTPQSGFKFRMDDTTIDGGMFDSAVYKINGCDIGNSYFVSEGGYVEFSTLFSTSFSIQMADNGTLTLDDTSFYGGYESERGFLVVGGTLTVTSSDFQLFKNSIFQLNGTTATFEEVTLDHSGNGNVNGGAISLLNNANLTGTDLTFQFNEASRGGAIFCENSYISLDSTSFVGNSAEVGGAVECNRCTSLAIDFGFFANSFQQQSHCINGAE